MLILSHSPLVAAEETGPGDGKSGNCHCWVTDGTVELRKSKESPERIVEPTKIGPDSEAYMFGRKYGPGGELKDGELSYRGDVALIWVLDEAKIKNADKTAVEIININLVDLADRLNKSYLSGTGWKIVVAEDAREVRASGTIDENLATTLTRFMRKGNFYCKLTSGVIEFKTKDDPRGEVRPLFPVPQEKDPK